ncbi:MAG: DUF3501 family protein [Acidobacteria bacterium]|nr:DUF3501 family protein [Acidobacteriota bacterium]
MRPLELEDLKNIAEYEKIREDLRRRVIALKKQRRVELGPFITLVFENRDTVLFQVQEMMRTERIVEESKIRHEIEIYNALIPGLHELSATLFIEIDDEDQLREWLPKLVDIEYHVSLVFPGGDRAGAVAEAGRSMEEKTSTVHYLKFPLTPEQVGVFTDPSRSVRLHVGHQHYSAETDLNGPTRQSLIQDLLVD